MEPGTGLGVDRPVSLVFVHGECACAGTVMVRPGPDGRSMVLVLPVVEGFRRIDNKSEQGG